MSDDKNINRLKQMVFCPIFPEELGALINRIEDGTISNHAAKIVLNHMWDLGVERRNRVIEGLEKILEKHK